MCINVPGHSDRRPGVSTVEELGLSLHRRYGICLYALLWSAAPHPDNSMWKSLQKMLALNLPFTDAITGHYIPAAGPRVHSACPLYGTENAEFLEHGIPLENPFDPNCPCVFCTGSSADTADEYIRAYQKWRSLGLIIRSGPLCWVKAPTVKTDTKIFIRNISFCKEDI